MKKIAALLLITVLLSTSCGPAYTDRIEEKYDIDVIAIRGKYNDGDVIYINSEGQTCAAAQGPNDVLIFQGCGEI